MGRPNTPYETPEGVKWHSRSVAVTGIVLVIIKDKLYLLVTKRSDIMEDMPGRWCLPCGYLDWDETIEEATIREIREETGFDVQEQLMVTCYKDGNGDAITYPNIVVHSDPKGNRQNVSISSAFLFERAELPEITTTEETSEVEWCEADPNNLKEKNLAFGQFDLVKHTISVLCSKMS